MGNKINNDRSNINSPHIGTAILSARCVCGSIFVTAKKRGSNCTWAGEDIDADTGGCCGIGFDDGIVASFNSSLISPPSSFDKDDRNVIVLT